MDKKFMYMALETALEGMQKKGQGPFGAVVVKNGQVISLGTNQVTTDFDPTAHAEICAIRQGAAKLKNFSLAGCEIYTSCEPCPMCLGAIFWARIAKVYYGATRIDAAEAGFDDLKFYQELNKPLSDRQVPMVQIMQEDCLKLLEAWQTLGKKIPY
jgi:guanine deaminase